MELIWIGNIYGCGSGYAGNVWDSAGLSPALMTMGGGNRQPMIIEYEKESRIRSLKVKGRQGEDSEKAD